MDFNLLGGLMALLVPDGLMHPYITLTLHAFVWHFLLLFVGFFIGFSRHGDTSLSGFIKTLPILLICIGAATLLNVLFHSYGDINMFYISPYKITTQPVFSQIMKRTGIWIGNLFYITAMCIAAFLIHRMFATIRQSCEKRADTLHLYKASTPHHYSNGYVRHAVHCSDHFFHKKTLPAPCLAHRGFFCQ